MPAKVPKIGALDATCTTTGGAAVIFAVSPMSSPFRVKFRRSVAVMPAGMSKVVRKSGAGSS